MSEILPEQLFADCTTIEKKYAALKSQVNWAIMHYTLVDTKGIFEVLNQTIQALNKVPEDLR